VSVNRLRRHGRIPRLITDPIFLCVLVWGAVGALACFNTMNRQWAGAGLTLAFFLNMSLLHWFSGMIVMLPWYMPPEYYSTVAGFKMSTIGIVAFAVGCFGLAPLLTPRPSEAATFRESKDDSIVFRIFLTVGLACFVLFAAGLGKIPTLSAVLSSGQSFVFVALGFGIWLSYLRQNRKQLLILLAVTPAFPLLTIFLQGFLGFGVSYATIVLCFFVAIYRPRLWASFLVIPLIYFGLSFYVTYMRDRAEIRGAVWGGTKLEARVDQGKKMFQQFEWFDPWERKHLDRVDIRLNYNMLVGAEISYLGLTKAYGRGETLWMSVLALIPRAIWTEKPIQAGSMDFVTRYAGIPVPEGTSVGIGLIFEFYANFGTFGVLIGMLIMGILVGYADRRAGEELRCGSPIVFAKWFLVGTCLLTVGGSLIEVFPGLILAVVWTAGLRHLFRKTLTGDTVEQSALPTFHATEP
jgi:hypothetical protein